MSTYSAGDLGFHLSYLFDLPSAPASFMVLLLFRGAVFHDHFTPRLEYGHHPFWLYWECGLIVLEGALEIHFDKGKIGLLKRAFLSALLVLLGTALLIALTLKALSDSSWYVCILNALPFAVISSSIAIPSVANMRKADREFVIYESSLSDILGIVVFDFVLFNEAVTSKSIVGLGLDMVAIVVISVVFCLGLLWLMGNLKHHIKFFLIMSVLVLVYALAKQFNLSSLIIVLAFGLLLNNADRLHHPVFARIFHYRRMSADLDG